MQTDGAEARRARMGKRQLLKLMKITREGAYKSAKQEDIKYRTAQDNLSSLNLHGTAATDL